MSAPFEGGPSPGTSPPPREPLPLRIARPSGAGQTRADRRTRIALTGVLSGLLFTSMQSLFVPWLVSFDDTRSPELRVFSVAAGMVLALIVAVFGPSGEPPGAKLATRLGRIIGTAGLVQVLIGATLALLLPQQIGLDYPTVAALAAGGIGTTLVVGIVASTATSNTNTRLSFPSSGVRLTTLVGGATGSVVGATWALATAFVLGHLQASDHQTSIEEAQDLVQLVASLRPDEADRVAGEIAPPGGYIAHLAAGGRVLPGGIGIARDGIVVTEGTPVSHCRVVGENVRAKPCAIRELDSGVKLVIAVSDVPTPVSAILVFVVVGLVTALGAYVVGATLGRGPATELERVASVLDALGRSGGGMGGLDQPIPAVSLDEVGDLAVALANLRVRLRPGLVEHDDALARARKADEERDRLLTLVSSELRAPLDRILDRARALLDGPTPLTPSQREDIRLIVTSSTHLTELIEEVLDLSAIATGQIQLRLGEVDFTTLVGDVARSQRPLLGGRPVELKLQLVDDARLRGDERRLRQVVTNLVSNAVKFTTEGSITMALARHGEGFRLDVSDTGPGMPAEQLPRLFTEFVQLGTLRQRARGTGLGLAICKRLIDAHGGSIAATSEPGRGTTFTVHLPLVPT